MAKHRRYPRVLALLKLRHSTHKAYEIIRNARLGDVKCISWVRVLRTWER